MQTDYCRYLIDAIAQLKQGKDGKQCNALGNDAASRLKDQTLIIGINQTDRYGRPVFGEYWSPEGLEAGLRAGVKKDLQAADYVRGVIAIAPNAFFSTENVFVTVAHEEAHAVFGLSDQTEEEANEGLISPAEAMAQACLYYNHH